MAHEEEDRLRPLRAALHQPDQRTWRRHLVRPTHAVRRRRAKADPVPPLWWGGEAPPAGDGAAGGLARTTADEGRGHRLALWQVVAAVLVLAGGVVLASGWLPADGPAPAGDGDGDVGSVETATGAGSRRPGADTEHVTAAEDPADGRAPGEDAADPASGGAAGASAVRLWPAADVEVHGREVRTDGGRWEVGAEGDVVTVGDWDCDRLPTPAVLRPSTGRVAVFDGWATEGAPMGARAVAAVPGAVAVGASTACGEIVVRSADGGEQVVDTTSGGGS